MTHEAARNFGPGDPHLDQSGTPCYSGSDEASAPAKTDAESRRLRLLDAVILLNSTLELKELTKIVLELVRDQVPVDRVTAFRVDRDQGLVRSLVAQEVQQEITMPIGSGIAGFVAATGDLLDIPDAYADARFNPAFDRLLNYQTKDLLALPVVNRQGAVIGVLELLNRVRPISSSDIESLQLVSIYIGVALQNALLYEQALRREQVERQLLQLRDRLAHLERSSIIAQVVSDVVHAINNPLAIAMGNVGLLKARLPSDDGTRGYLKKIEDALDRAGAVARTLGCLSDGQDLSHNSLEVRELLRQVIELRSDEWQLRGIEGTIDMQQTPVVHGNAGQLQVALMHILMNAEQALQNTKGGRIAVRLFNNPTQNHVRIEIQNSSPDLVTTATGHLSEPFRPTESGTATTRVELALVKSIVERHAGRTSLETVPGHGTTFIIELPIGAPPQA